MKLGTLGPVSYTRNGVNVNVSSGGVKLTSKAAKRLNGKLGLDNALKGTMSDSQSAIQVKAATPANPQPPAKEGETPKGQSSAVVGTMTRNLYLGADLAPAIAAGTPEALFNAAGQILGEVEHNDFPTRAVGLAEEILTEEPDLVGLQEVALWRTAPPNPGVLTDGPSATTVKYDYLQELLDQLNAEGQHYEVVVVQPEFDFEVPANTGGSPAPRHQRPPDDARRDPQAEQRGRRNVECRRGQFRHSAPGPDPRHPAAGQTRLDGHRRQRARQPAVPVRQHAPRGVRAPTTGPRRRPN